MAGKIFLNYRRGDDPGFTQALYQRLEEEFTAERLFMDVEGHIKPGDDFVDVLSSQVVGSDIVLVLIGRRWIELMAERTSQREDFVAIEIKAALDGGKRVIPVLVGGATMPHAEALPDAIRALARRNAVALRPDRFKADCQGLVAALKEQLATADADRAARAQAEQRAERMRVAHEAEESARAMRAKELEKERSHADIERARLAASERRAADASARADVLRTGGSQERRAGWQRQAMRFPPPLAVGTVSAVCGAVAYGRFSDHPLVSLFGQNVQVGPAIAAGLSVGAALWVWTDTNRAYAAIAAVLSSIGWFFGEAVAFSILAPVSGQQSAAALFLWGVLNWSITILAVSLVRRRADPILWVVAVVAGGVAGLAFYMPDQAAVSLTVRGAVYFMFPMAYIGHLISHPASRSVEAGVAESGV